jgi:hypothetical protein
LPSSKRRKVRFFSMSSREVAMPFLLLSDLVVNLNRML